MRSELSQPLPDLERVSAFLRGRREEVLRSWQQAIRSLPPARCLEPSRLLDHVPALLDRIVELTEQAERGEPVGPPECIPDMHALERLDEGFDLNEVITEYRLLRRCLLELLGSEPRLLSTAAMEMLHDVIDHAIERSVAAYAKARERTLVALDRISAAALNGGGLDAFLARLLKILMETTAAIDTAAIFLREQDTLRLRAAAGLEGQAPAGFSVKMDEGFIGKIAAERAPRELRMASSDPLVKSPMIRGDGVRALYGVPLEFGGEVIGVAEMGSRTAFEFSQEDKLLFRAMANKATALVAYASLRETAELAARDRQRALAQEQALHAQAQATADFGDQMIAVISHDLRNPLSAILASTQLLFRYGQMSDGQRRAVQRIANSGERMVRMIGELLDFTRGRLGGGIPVQPEPMDLTEACRRVIDEMQVAHPGRPLALRVVGDSRGEWDPGRIAQVVSNLLGNAIQHGHEGTPVQVELRGLPDTVELDVSNRGAPIPPDVMSKLFQPFSRGAADPASKSLGLGLYIVKEVVDAHGGRIDVRSTEADGTTFTVRLPRMR